MGIIDGIKGLASPVFGATTSVAAAVLGPVVRKALPEDLDPPQQQGAESRGPVQVAEQVDEASDAARAEGHGPDQVAEEVDEAFDAARETGRQLVLDLGERSLRSLGEQLEAARFDAQAVGEQLATDDPAVRDLLSQLSDVYATVDNAIEHAWNSLKGGDEGGSEGRRGREGEATWSGGAEGQPSSRSEQAPRWGDRQGDQNGVNASSAAAQMAQELGVDLASLEGSGAQGMVTARDVLAAQGDSDD